MKNASMKILMAAASMLSLAACFRPAAPYINKGNMLSEAGFVAHPANTTARYSLMNQLPPGQVTYRMGIDGKPVFVYGDPIACGCVYMGDRTAYERYAAILSHSGNNNKKGRTGSASSLLDGVPDYMKAENNRDSTQWDWTVWSAAADPDSNQPRHMIGNYW